jgi:hypothetical protein
MSYKRDEVYRHGIVAINSKGQESFVKWIADIKIPTDLDSPSHPIATTSSNNYINAVGIEFTVNCTPLIAQGAVAFKIVRVERKKEDRTILTQGIASKMFYVGAGTSPYFGMITGYPRAVIKTPSEGIHASYTPLSNVIQFISPEINYFKDLSPMAFDYLKVVGVLNDRRTYLTTTEAGVNYSIDVVGTNERVSTIHSSTFPALYSTHPWMNYSKYQTASSYGITTLTKHPILEGVLAGAVESGGEDENKINFASVGYPVLNRSVDFSTVTIRRTIIFNSISIWH